MKINLQEVCLNMGKTGCYFLSIVHLASIAIATYERERGHDIDPFDIDLDTSIFRLYYDAINNEWIDKNFFVKEPGELMEALLKGIVDSVGVRHESVSYEPKENEYEITRFDTKTGIAHFVCTHKGNVVYDPFGYSKEQLGTPASKRIFRILFS